MELNLGFVPEGNQLEMLLHQGCSSVQVLEGGEKSRNG